MPLPFAIPAAGKIAGAIGIRGFVMIGLGLSLAFMVWRADSLSGQRDAALERVGAERVAHDVTRGSLALLQAKITELNAEANHRADLFEISQQEAAREAESLERAARVSQGQIDRLRALSGLQGSCAVPGELSDALGGL